MLFKEALLAAPHTSFATHAKSSIPSIIPGDDDSDLVTLLPFMDYINDPTLLQALMEQQGVQNISSVEPTGPLGGGTADNNYKGYIHWLDGTQSKVQIKGSRSTDTPPASYREQMYYSRVTETFNDDVNTPYSYTSVADIESGQGMFVNEFMIGYTSLSDVQAAVFAGTLDEIGFGDFDIDQNNYDVMTMLGHFQGSHFEDPWLEQQFYMKGYDWTPIGNMTAGQDQMQTQIVEGKQLWNLLKLTLHGKLDSNLIACVNQMFDIWTWDNFQTAFNDVNYTQSLVHGDFHSGQIMINPDDYSDLVLLDWEWSGFSNPGIDIATWFNFYPKEDMLTNEVDWYKTYYKALISENPELLFTYPFEQLKADILYYGTSHILVRNIGLGGQILLGGDIETAQNIMDCMATWVNEHNLTPDDMAVPMYQFF